MTIDSSAATGDGILPRAVDWLFGYDFFISYSHGDGLNLPRLLKARLEQAGFRVFLDQTDYVAGLDLRRETRRQVLKSRKIVVVGRPHALRSTWVKREIDIALAHGRIPVIIDINGAVAGASEEAPLAVMARERHWLRLNETLPDADGEVSERTVAELVRGFGHTRQQAKRQRVFAAAAGFLAVAAGIATWQAIEARRQQLAAERNLAAAKGAVNVLIVDIARGLRDVEGMRAESVGRILAGAETALDKIAVGAAGDRFMLQSRVTMYNEFVETYLEQGMAKAAREAAARSVGHARQLLASAEGERAARQLLARGLLKLGDAHLELGEFARARSTYEEAHHLREELAAAPGDAIARRDVAIALTRLGEAADAGGDLETARGHFAASLAMREELAVARPEWRRDVTLGRIRLGDVLLDTGRNAQASAAFEAAIELAMTLRAADLTNSKLVRDLAVALQRRGNHALKVGAIEQARTASRKASPSSAGSPARTPHAANGRVISSSPAASWPRSRPPPGAASEPPISFVRWLVSGANCSGPIRQVISCASTRPRR